MSWFFSVALPADPAPCQDAASTLRSVARAAEEAAGFLAGQAGLPREDFSGRAAQSYREASAVLGSESQGIADDTRSLAVALDGYAVRISAVRRALTRVRSDAVEQGLVVTADELVEWGPAPGTDIDALYQRLEARAVRAHAEAEAAYADWWRAMQEHTAGPLASPTWPVESLPEPPRRPDEHRSTADHVGRPAVESPAPAGRPTSAAGPVDHDVDLGFAPLPPRWRDLYDRPTATEGAPR